MNDLLFLVPLFAALTGWLVIRIIIFFLFNKNSSSKFYRFSVTGILQSRQSSIASKAGQFAQDNFESFGKIEEKISNPDQLKKILPMIESHIDDFLKNKLAKEIPMIGMFIGDKTVGKVKEALMKEIESLFPQVMSAYAANLKKDINIKELVAKKVLDYSPSEAGNSIRTALKPDLEKAAYLGALIGFILGLVQMGIFALLLYK